MRDDPKTSVLNKFNQNHDIKNLFVQFSIGMLAQALKTRPDVSGRRLVVLNTLHRLYATQAFPDSDQPVSGPHGRQVRQCVFFLSFENALPETALRLPSGGLQRWRPMLGKTPFSPRLHCAE
jgi:hypothetical protein